MRFDSRDETNTPKGINLINIGFDNMLVLVVKNKIYGFQIPTEGSKMEAQFKEIYSHNKNIIDVINVIIINKGIGYFINDVIFLFKGLIALPKCSNNSPLGLIKNLLKFQEIRKLFILFFSFSVSH